MPSKRTPNRTCEWCGVSFRIAPRRPGRWCSWECRYAARPRYTCAHCGADFIPSRHSAKLYCSLTCWRAAQALFDITAFFWAHVEKTDTCWIWNGGRNAYGYGVIRKVVDGKLIRLMAHRFSYESFVGELGSLFALHRCDNPPCVRPDHLFAGTQAENVADKVAKQRHNRGETHGHHRLTEDQVRTIRERYAAGGISQASLAREYGITQTSVGSLIRREHWKHVT